MAGSDIGTLAPGFLSPSAFPFERGRSPAGVTPPVPVVALAPPQPPGFLSPMAWSAVRPPPLPPNAAQVATSAPDAFLAFFP